MVLLLLLLNSAALADCAPVALASVVREVRVLLEDAEPEQALALVQTAEAALPCADRLLTPDELGQLYQLGGTAALRLGKLAEAEALLATAARMADAVSFDVTLGASALDAYERQRAQVRAQARAQVIAYIPARLDGLDLPLSQAREIAPGAHLIQRIDASGAVRTTLETVAPGGRLSIGEPLPPAPAQPTRHLGLALTGSALALGGAALVWVGIDRDATLGDLRVDDPAYTTELRRRNTLLGVGAAGVGAGWALVTTGAMLSVGLDATGPGWSITW